MDIEVIPAPRYELRVDKNEAMAIRNGLGVRLTDQTITNKERRVAEAMKASLDQQGLGDFV